MKIALDKKKYRIRIVSLLFLSIFTFILFFFYFYVTFFKDSGSFIKMIIGMILIILLHLFSSYLLLFYLKLRKIRECVIIYENGVLSDFTKPIFRPLFLRIDQIQDISIWSKAKGILQFRIITEKNNNNQVGLNNQLKGKHLYVTDSVVDRDELIKLMEMIQKELINKDSVNSQ